jgi:hypothetical protein
MAKFHHSASHGLGSREEQSIELPSKNHIKTASISPSAMRKVADLGLQRVAGNAWLCPSTKDLWRINGDKVIRITLEEVDNGEEIVAEHSENPSMFLADVLADLTL